MRAAIYARVSSVAQREQHTIESQLRVLPEFIARRGWTLVGAPYIDDGHTAKAGHLEKRTAFTRLLRDAAAGLFDVVVVVDLDRLTRSEDMTERGQVLGAFQRAGVQLAIAATGQLLDLSTSPGDLFASLAGYFAAEENRKRRERSLRGRAEAIRRGRNPAGPTPYGLAFDAAGGAWSLVADQAAIVRECYQRIAAGESGPTIGRDLEARRVPSKRGGRWAAGVWRLVTSPTYRGEYQAAGPDGPTIAVPPVVDDVLWYAAQDALKRGGRRSLDRTKHAYLVARLARCGCCGGSIWTAPASPFAPGGKLRRAYYTCPNRRYPRDGRARCELGYLWAEDIDRRVWAAVVQVLSSPTVVARALGRRGELADEGGLVTEDLRGYQLRLERLAAASTAILERFRRGLIPEAVMDAELAAAARQRAFLQQQVASAQARATGAERSQVALEAVLAQLAPLRARLETISAAARRPLLDALVAGVELGPGARVVVDFVLPDVRQAAGGSAVAMAAAPASTPRHDCDSREALRFRVVA